ncbi:HAL/PAL/TAL family ammonia-lyase [Sphingobacterium sp. SYP-B4668]|uniref:HAL/PAL/TAL family ammonia-lyase n=1 Tax=Sphingobacterium sp. SYP-B4668 TaxID=2996035 RepID=UPI0022DE1E58|nr:aromatic amino acid ammonia-lyase [Sphingobacterium sp. SYP-B4668]
MRHIEERLRLEDFYAVLFNNDTIEISQEARIRVEESFNFLKEFAENKVIYGVNTGFGPMAQYRIDDADRQQLQYNLIRSHASGTGEPLCPLFVKSAVLARLNTLSIGYSGVHPSTIELMRELINRDITPLIFAHGGVGASGDLVQLAHLALVLIGEGEVFYKGKRCPTHEAFTAEGLSPIKIEVREGLSLINGTSVMTGIGIANVLRARKLLDCAIRATCAINELVRSYDDHYSEPLNNVKLHTGQRNVAASMRSILASSKRTRKREEHLYTGDNQERVFKEKVQEYYSLRCVPQILGPVMDTLDGVASILEDEVNSVSDNPVVDVANKHVYHGGNFHGDYISLEMDKLKIVVTKLTMLAERQLNYLLNSRINEFLPPFVNLGQLGFNFGMQGVQFTATSTTAESQTLSNPMYVHSIPNNNDNQDIVSMGTNAAVLASRVVENAFEVLAIEWITIAQAVDYLGCQAEVSESTSKIYDSIRQIIPVFKDDQVMYPYVQQVKDYLMKMD